MYHPRETTTIPAAPTLFDISHPALTTQLVPQPTPHNSHRRAPHIRYHAHRHARNTQRSATIAAPLALHRATPVLTPAPLRTMQPQPDASTHHQRTRRKARKRKRNRVAASAQRARDSHSPTSVGHRIRVSYPLSSGSSSVFKEIRYTLLWPHTRSHIKRHMSIFTRLVYLFHIYLSSTHPQMDGQTNRPTNQHTNTLTHWHTNTSTYQHTTTTGLPY